jgi:hypothetical protein
LGQSGGSKTFGLIFGLLVSTFTFHGVPARAQDAQDKLLSEAIDAREPGTSSAGTLSLLQQSTTRQWQAVSRKAHETEWHAIRHVTNRLNGQVRAYTNTVIELGAGLNRFDAAKGSWQSASPAFRITDQGVVVDRASHFVRLAPNINSIGAVTVRKGDLKFAAHPLCIAYYDPLDGQSYRLADITDSVGWLISPSEVVYSNCFKGLRASIRYRSTLAGLEQDLLLHESPPAPEELGFSPHVRLELFSEMVGETPVPQLATRFIERETDPARRQLMFEPDFVDQALGFGPMKMGRGKSYLHPQPAGQARWEGPREVDVGKRFQVIDGRRIVIEAVQHWRIQPYLNKLPRLAEAIEGVTNAALRDLRTSRDGLFAGIYPPMDLPTVPAAGVTQRAARIQTASTAVDTAGNSIQRARAGQDPDREPSRLAAVGPGAARANLHAPTRARTRSANQRDTPAPQEVALVLDWQLLDNTQPVEDYSFFGTNTYSIVAPVALANVTLIGGAVLKFSPSSSSGASITIHGTVTCDASDLPPIICTARDHDLVGEIVPDSTGTPQPFGYGTEYLRFDGPAGVILKHLRMMYGGAYALAFANGGAQNEVWHSQFVHTWGLWAENTTVKLRNVLFHDITTLVWNSNGVVEFQWGRI